MTGAEQTEHIPAIAAVVLAGGLARRMGGGDKGLKALGNAPLLARVIAAVRPQVAHLALNANGDPSRFAAFALPVLADDLPDHPGPLAGVLAGMVWARQTLPGISWLLSVPSDTPFLPADLVARLFQAVAAAPPATHATVQSGASLHPVIGLWPVALADALRQAMVTEGLRKVDVWTRRYPRRIVTWPTIPVDPFFNANTPADLQAAEALLDAGGPALQEAPSTGS